MRDVPSVNQSWSHCFACGPREVHGLQLAYRFLDATTLEAECAFDQRFQGFDGVIHGGILVTALDDAMANIACLQGEAAVTAELTSRFHAPVAVDEPIHLTASVTRRKGRFMECVGEIRDLAGVLRVSASGKFIITGPLPSLGENS